MSFPVLYLLFCATRRNQEILAGRNKMYKICNICLYPICRQKQHFFASGAARLLHPYWFRGLQGGTPSKSAPREVALISLSVSPVTLVTFRDYIPNSAPLHTQLHIHSTASNGNATHSTIHTLNMQTRRIRVPSRKARANEDLDFEIYEDLQKRMKRTNLQPREIASTPHSISEQASSIPAQPTATNNSDEATASQPTKSRRSKKKKQPATSTTPNITKEASALPLKLRSILDQPKSARELRQDPATALFPLIAKSKASWDNLPLEGTPGKNPYADGALPAAPPIPEAESMEGYYTHPKFFLMPRRIHEGQVNLPADLTDPICLFTLFYSLEHVETFVHSTNQYAEEELKLERRGDSELPSHSHYLNWKPLTIRETYIFLGILILMGSDRRPKIKDYWRTPRAAEKAPSAFHNYMGLKRFETIHRLFTASPMSVNGPCVSLSTNDPPRCAPTPKRKPTARCQGAPPANGKRSLPASYWEKVKPLASHIRETCQRMYTPGTHVTIDEIMLAFRERSHNTTKLKNKPIGEGFKNWVLADHEYVWKWEWHSMKYGSESAREPLNSRIPKELPETQRIIMRLALALPADSLNYILYLDNLFTSLPLAKALKEASIGMTGTTRKNTKETPPWLLELKQKNKELVWNSALDKIVKGILIFLWQDNNAVIGKLPLG
jgi:hypothetical protein